MSWPFISGAFRSVGVPVLGLDNLAAETGAWFRTHSLWKGGRSGTGCELDKKLMRIHVTEFTFQIPRFLFDRKSIESFCLSRKESCRCSKLNSIEFRENRRIMIFYFFIVVSRALIFHLKFLYDIIIRIMWSRASLQSYDLRKSASFRDRFVPLPVFLNYFRSN